MGSGRIQGIGFKRLEYLKRIDLSDSKNLIMTPDFTDGYDLVIPGSEVPKWFSHQSEGASVNLQVPSDLCNKCIGIALCSVFVLADHQQPDQLLASHQHASYRTMHALSCYFKANGYEYSTQPIFRYSEESGKVEAHHLWLTFILPEFFNEDWKEAFNQIDANGFSHIKIEFEAEGPGLEVKRCGLRLVSKQDIEDLNQIMTWCSSGRITPYKRLNVLHHHFDNSVFAANKLPSEFFSPYSKNDEVIGLSWQGETVALLADVTCTHKRVDLNKVAIYKIED
nr:hypothetical protein CFP56_34438 [Quercus suber]